MKYYIDDTKLVREHTKWLEALQSNDRAFKCNMGFLVSELPKKDPNDIINMSISQIEHLKQKGILIEDKFGNIGYNVKVSEEGEEQS